jgi:glycosyltransferase involved in cell wall biosynthesis
VRISVIIPCFDSAAWLPATLHSVLAQTLPPSDVELVLVDDGSRDATPQLLRQAVAEHPERAIRCVFQQNAGVAAARNRGISLARGRYILPLDADDLLAPTMLEACAAVLDAAPEVDLVYTDREEFGDVQATWSAGRFELERLKYFNQLSACSLYRRTLWERVGGYRLNVDGFDDWDLWIAAAARGMRARHLPQALFRHRKRGDSQLRQLLPRYEALFARVILNNREVYAAHEVEAAQRCVDGGEVAPFLRSARFVFMGHFHGRFARPALAEVPPCAT